MQTDEIGLPVLNSPEGSYLLGLLQSDGHLSQATRNRGRLTLESQSADRVLLEQIQPLFPCYSSIRDRCRNTNFASSYTSSSLSVYTQAVRQRVHEWGVPFGKKSTLVELPSQPYSPRDYFRGWIDGDGSLGWTKLKRPFVSLVTSSDNVCAGYCTFLSDICGLPPKHLTRNHRDHVFNICVFMEGAVQVAREVYYHGCLGLPRKITLSQDIRKWLRPAGFRQQTWASREWTPAEDQIVLTYSVTDAVQLLGRTRKSIGMRRWRLRQKTTRGLTP